MKVEIPETLKLEHEELHSELAEATREGGKIGEAAKKVAKLMHPHFVREEEFALPPIGVLKLLSENKVKPGMKEIILMTDRLKKHLPEMLREHKNIVNALDELIAAAREEKKIEYVAFSEKLKLHAQNEEEVLYPAAILVGECIKLKFQ